jgi:hypothetical protein
MFLRLCLSLILQLCAASTEFRAKILQSGKPSEEEIFIFCCKTPKFVKYGTYEPQNMEIALEVPTNGDVGLNAASRAYPLPEDT